MIRHAGLGPPQPIVALAHPMQSSASVRPFTTVTVSEHNFGQ